MTAVGTFECGNCHGVFLKGQTDEEARAEYEMAMPQAAQRGDEEDVVCDDCYRQIMAWAKREGIDL